MIQRMPTYTIIRLHDTFPLPLDWLRPCWNVRIQGVNLKNFGSSLITLN